MFIGFKSQCTIELRCKT